MVIGIVYILQVLDGEAGVCLYLCSPPCCGTGYFNVFIEQILVRIDIGSVACYDFGNLQFTIPSTQKMV